MKRCLSWKAPNFLHSPLKLRTTFNLKKQQQQPRNLLYPWYRSDWPRSLTRCWLCSSTADCLPGALNAVSSQMGTSHVPIVSAAHSSECSCYSKCAHQDRHLYFVAQKPTWTDFTWKISIYCFSLSLINHRDISKQYMDLQQSVGEKFRQEKSQLSCTHQTYFSMCKSSFLCFICYNNVCLPTYFSYFYLCLQSHFSWTVFLA